MSLGYTVGGFFTAPSSQMKQLALPGRPDLFYLENVTDWGDDTAITAVKSEWETGLSEGQAFTTDQAVTTGILSSNFVTANGYTFFNTAQPPTFAPLATTGISGNAGTFICTMANTGSIAVGDYVRLYATTGELQIAGYVFQVTAVTTNTSITLGYMASGGQTFAAAATAGQVKKIIPNLMYPRKMLIAGISQAAQGVVFFTTKNDFTPGELVSFRIPSEFGMTQLNNVQARVLSVTNSSTVSSITIDLNTSGFTAFAFPTSAVAAAGVSPAIAVPSASGVVPDSGSATVPQQPPGTNLLDAFDDRNKHIMQMGSGVLTVAGAVYNWRAIKYDEYTAG